MWVSGVWIEYLDFKVEIILTNQVIFLKLITNMNEDSVATNGPIHGHKTFTFGDVTLSSDFDAGNMLKAERCGDDSFWIWTANDAMYT